MGLERAEHQNLFNAKRTAEKNYKIRERTSDFFWGDAIGIGIDIGVRRSRSNQRARSPKHHQARQAGLPAGWHLNDAQKP